MSETVLSMKEPTSSEGDGGNGEGGGGQQYDLSGTPDWVKGLDIDDSIKADPSLRAIQDVNNLAKSYVNAQKMIGSDKIVVPGKHASEADWQEVYRKLGHPDNVEAYDLGIKLEDGQDSDFFNGYRETAHKLGILPHQAKDLYKWHEETMSNMIQAHEAQEQLEQQKGIEHLQKQWGKDGWDSNIRLARAAVDHLGGEDLINYLEQTGLGNDPMLIQVFAKMGQMYKEDGIIEGEGLGVGSSKEDIQTELNTIMADINGPYYNKSHPNHRQSVEHVQRLNQKLYG